MTLPNYLSGCNINIAPANPPYYSTSAVAVGKRPSASGYKSDILALKTGINALNTALVPAVNEHCQVIGSIQASNYLADVDNGASLSTGANSITVPNSAYTIWDSASQAYVNNTGATLNVSAFPSGYIWMLPSGSVVATDNNPANFPAGGVVLTTFTNTVGVVTIGSQPIPSTVNYSQIMNVLGNSSGIGLLNTQFMADSTILASSTIGTWLFDRQFSYTPVSANSKILIWCQMSASAQTTGGRGVDTRLKIGGSGGAVVQQVAHVVAVAPATNTYFATSPIYHEYTNTSLSPVILYFESIGGIGGSGAVNWTTDNYRIHIMEVSN